MESGTVTHVPPENWADPRQKKNDKFDVFGFGVAVWEILTELSPYDRKFFQLCDEFVLCGHWTVVVNKSSKSS